MATLDTSALKTDYEKFDTTEYADCEHEDPCIHKEARTKIESKKVVVHGARITCSMAKNVGNTRITVKDGYGFIQGGKLCAHEQSCIPVKNIPFFPGCRSEDVEKVLKALYSKANSDMQKRYDEAFKAITVNKESYNLANVPCTLPLLDRWFDADEKEIVTKNLRVGEEIAEKIKMLKKELKKLLNKEYENTLAISNAYDFADSTKYTREECRQYGEISALLAQMSEKIEKKVSKFLETFNTKIQINGENFEDVVSQLQSAKSLIKEIGLEWDTIHIRYNGLPDGLPEYETYKARLGWTIEGGEKWKDGEYNQDIDKLIEEIREWKEDELHLILDDSFLVCRCGGIISFLDSGQDFCKIVDNLEASILATVTQLKERCLNQGTDYEQKDDNDTRNRKYSYKEAAKGLKKFVNLLLGKEDTSSINVCVYVELVCKSYNDEIKQRMITLLSLITLLPHTGALAFALAIYTLSTIENDTKGAADGVSADISAWEAAYKISDRGFNALVKYNNGYTLLSSIINLFYVSYDSQIEDIKITVFSDYYAHVIERKVKKTGELVEEALPGLGINCYTPYEFDRYGEGRGGGLKWMQDPGLYLNQLVHLGDDINSGEEIGIDKKDTREG